MDQTLRQEITEELTAFLKRAPTENEIMNGQTDTNLMSRITLKRQQKIQEDVSTSKSDISNLKLKAK